MRVGSRDGTEEGVGAVKCGRGSGGDGLVQIVLGFSAF